MKSSVTQVSVDSTKSTGIATTSHGSNIDVVAFNISLISRVRPSTAVQLLKIYDDLKALTDADPTALDEDFDSAINKRH